MNPTFTILDLKNWNFLRYLSLLILIFYSCRGHSYKPVADSLVYETTQIAHAERFRLDKTPGYTKVSIINPWQGADNVIQDYYLIRRGNVLPDGIDSSLVVFVPLERIVCMSTTHLAMISALNEENSIIGVSGAEYVFSDNIIGNIEKGLVEDVGYESNLNKELILKISPDLIMMYAIGSESSGYIGKLRELGMRVMFNADYLEKDPLSKAEWIKLFGALYCKENLADSIFKTEVDAYNEIRSFININTTYRPKVMLGLPFKDTWYISPGNSFISKMIDDAGGNYLWQNTISSVSMPYGIENIYMLALTADYWLNIGAVNSENEISVVDQRFKDLPCFINGNLYNNNNRTTVNGGNDFWESGTIYPHLILKDIASILHPGLFPDYDLFFYRKINK